MHERAAEAMGVPLCSVDRIKQEGKRTLAQEKGALLFKL
jgi:hypothetical protein